MADDTLRDDLVDTLYRHRVDNAAATIEGWPGEDQAPLLCRVLRQESETFVDALLPTVRRAVEQARADERVGALEWALDQTDDLWTETQIRREIQRTRGGDPDV